MKVVIVGGVAGGASCAARLRPLDEVRITNSNYQKLAPQHGTART